MRILFDLIGCAAGVLLITLVIRSTLIRTFPDRVVRIRHRDEDPWPGEFEDRS